MKGFSNCRICGKQVRSYERPKHEEECKKKSKLGRILNRE